jgi:hypothetical protein
MASSILAYPTMVATKARPLAIPGRCREASSSRDKPIEGFRKTSSAKLSGTRRSKLLDPPLTRKCV